MTVEEEGRYMLHCMSHGYSAHNPSAAEFHGREEYEAAVGQGRLESRRRDTTLQINLRKEKIEYMNQLQIQA